MNIVVPLCDTATITRHGVKILRYLIEVDGMPLFIRCITDICEQQRELNGEDDETHVMFIVKDTHLAKYDIEKQVDHFMPGGEVLQTQGVTRGDADVAKQLYEFIDNDDELLLVTPDHIAQYDMASLRSLSDRQRGAVVLTDKVRSGEPEFWAGVKYSSKHEEFNIRYLGPEKNDKVLAAVGVYYWKYGFDFIKFATQLNDKNHMVDGKFRVPSATTEAHLYGDLEFAAHVVNDAWLIQRAKHLTKYDRHTNPH